MQYKRITAIGLSVMMGLSTGAYADMPDPYQNDGSDNFAYDVVSKFYAGGSLGWTLYNQEQNTGLTDDAFNIGAFLGYKFNDNFAIEANGLRMGDISATGYKTSLYNLSVDALASVPVMRESAYTLSLYAKAGYGFNFISTDYTDQAGDRNIKTTKGVINAGVGINLDLSSNISMRAGYSWYQTKYPSPKGHGSSANVFSIGIYYNFA